MPKLQKKVDWSAYAEKYDMLLGYNPFYQELRTDVLKLVETWSVNKGERIIDVGAGTGNYSVFLAEQFPDAQVIHIDSNTAMNERAKGKKKAAGVQNLEIFTQGIETVTFPPHSFKGLISVHALYTFPDPQRALRKMHDWLQPGGLGIIVDPGRVVKVFNWQLAIARHLVKRYGLFKTLKIFRAAQPVSRQNRHIRHLQRSGKLWTHTPEEFARAVEAAGFTILESSVCFRGLSDMVIVTTDW